MEGVLFFVEEVFYLVKWCSTFWVEHWHNKGVRSASAALWELDFRSRYSPGSIIIQLRICLLYTTPNTSTTMNFSWAIIYAIFAKGQSLFNCVCLLHTTPTNSTTMNFSLASIYALFARVNRFFIAVALRNTCYTTTASEETNHSVTMTRV